MRTSFILFLTAVISISACIKARQEFKSSTLAESGNSRPEAATDKISYGKIIRNGELELLVNCISKSHQKIDSLLSSSGAFIASETESNSNERLNATLIIRVPENRFESLLAQISSFAKHVDSRNVNSQDVSTQLIDLEARIHSKKEMEIRLLELVKRTGKLSELITLENKLAEVRAEIERMQSQLVNMNEEIRYSTLTVSLYELIPGGLSNEPGFFFRMTNAFTGGWKMIQTVLITLTYIWPFLLILLTVAFFLNRKNLLRNN